MATEVKYGDFSLDIETLPQVSVLALVRRGLAHYLGNEQASKLATWAEKHAESHGGDGPNDAERAAAKHDFQAAAVEALIAGTVGATVRGPRGSAVDTVMRSLAESEVKAVLKDNGITMPTGDKTISLAGQTLSRQDLIQRRIDKHGDRLRKEAEKKIAADERKAKAEGGVESLL